MTTHSSDDSVDDSVSALFEKAAAAYADRDFLHVPWEACRDYSPIAPTVTYSDARVRMAALAARFRAAGYGAGHRIAIALDNRPEFFLHFLALNSLGASIVPLNAAMGMAELAYVIEHSDASLAVTHRGHEAHLKAALAKNAALWIAGEGGERVPPPTAAMAAPVASPGEAALLYTSGSTGTPKGCLLSNEYFM